MTFPAEMVCEKVTLESDCPPHRYQICFCQRISWIYPIANCDVTKVLKVSSQYSIPCFCLPHGRPRSTSFPSPSSWDFLLLEVGNLFECFYGIFLIFQHLIISQSQNFSKNSDMLNIQIFKKFKFIKKS